MIVSPESFTCPHCHAAKLTASPGCRECGHIDTALLNSLLITPPLPGPPTPAPMPTSPQTIVRHYNTAADRDLDAARMVQGGWFVTQVGQNGEQEQVTYSTTAPPGRALLPHQIGVSLRHSNRRVFATVAAIGLLLVCALVAAVALAGGDAEANSVAPNTGRMWQGVPLYPDATLLERTTDTVSVYGTQHDPAQVSSWFDREWRRAGLTYQFDLVKDGRTFHFYQSGSVTYAYAVTKGRDKPYLIGLIVNR